ncbi:hypothetical protein HK104_011214 [Borealophlyctis nickersoniae]|nr:hypothetical protein HK104_011214 [Borealophlyctis nickersoniae]
MSTPFAFQQQTYRVAVYTAYGTPSQKVQVQSLPTDKLLPTEPGHVLVQVRAASINPIDYKKGEGALKMVVPLDFPSKIGYDVAGVVLDVKDGKKFKVGDEVFGRIGENEAGSLGEYVLTTEDKLARKPTSLTFEEAAAVPLAALTAYQTIERGTRGPDKEGAFTKAFIPAGAGGVGMYGIQLARHAFGFTTVATTVSEKKIDLVKSLGADVTVDYKKEKYEQTLKDYDFVLDTTGDVANEVKILRKGGWISSIAAIPDSAEMGSKFPLGFFMSKILDLMSLKYRRVTRSAGVHYQYVWMEPNGEMLGKIAELAEQGKLKVVIDKVFELDKAAEALEYLREGHATGKVVIRVVS